MKNEKANTGRDAAPTSEFIQRTAATAAALQDLVKQDEDNRCVLLIASEGSETVRALCGSTDRLTGTAALSMAKDDDAKHVMLRAFVRWLDCIDRDMALNITQALYEAVRETKGVGGGAAKRPKAEA